MTEGIGKLRTFWYRRGGGISRFLAVCFIVASIYHLPQKTGNYGEVIFSEWRGVSGVDYSTNAPVTDYYSHCNPRYTRQAEWEGFIQRLSGGDTLTIGLDYYALTGISSWWFPEQILIRHFRELSYGRIVIVRSYLRNGKIIMEDR